MAGLEGSNPITCVVCYKNVEIYSIGMCEHPVCYECSTRMRVLCRQNECPICRQDLPEVVFTKDIKPFRNPKKEGLPVSFRYNIYFENTYIYKKFHELLAENCNMCREKKTFESFEELRDHMRQEHQLYHCDLCVENLKIFARERRWYTRAELSMHRRKGDLDDRSHRGHPLCEFCNQRYMDNDELYRHLRRDHLYCHFCDEDGLHQYYDSYDYLRDHFRLEHFLCEEGECAEEKFTSVFRTDIDLKAHRTSAHSKQLSKAAAKQARTLELEFTLAPRDRMRRVPYQNRRDREFSDTRDNIQGYVNTSNLSNFHNSQGAQHSPNFQNPQNFQSYPNYHNSSNAQNFQQFAGPGTSRDEYPCYLEPTFMRPQVDVQSTEEFPTLGGGTSVTAPTFNTAQKGRGNVTIRSTLRNQKLAVTDENFPALGPESSISKTVNVSLSGNSGGNLGNGTSNVSIQVNHEGNGTVMRVSGPNIRIRPSLKIDSEFPALGGNEQAAGGNGSGGNNGNAPWKEVLQWTCSKTNSKVAVGSKKKNATGQSQQPIHGDDFPTLSKSKKQSTLTMVPTWGPQAQNSPSQQQNSQGMSSNGTTKGKTKKKKEKRGGGGSGSGGAEGNSKKDTKENECAENWENAGNFGRLGSAASTRNGAENAEGLDDLCNSANSRSAEDFDYFNNTSTTGNSENLDYFSTSMNPRNSSSHGNSGTSRNTGKLGNSSNHKSTHNYESLDNVRHSKSAATPRNTDNLENFDYFNNTANSGNFGNSRNSFKSGNVKNADNSESSLNFGNSRTNTKSASSSNSLNSQSPSIAQKGSNCVKDEQSLKKDKRKQRTENKGSNCCTTLNVTNSAQNSSNSQNSKNSQNSSDSNDSNSDSNLNSKSTTNLTLNSNSKTTAKSSSNCNSNSASKSPTKSTSNVNVNSSSKLAAKSSSNSTNQNTSKSQRKRTELKIDSLNANSTNPSAVANSKNSNNSNDNSNSYGEYPVASSAAAKPPGFTHPPPGFTNPPPGFSIKYNLDNNLTFTNSSGETYSILPDRPCDLEKQFTMYDAKSYLYTPPADFQERNKRLVAKLNDVLLEQDNIEEFRQISGLFRQGSCTPDEYYEHCRRVIGHEAFREIFPELLLLLPDIKQQQELFGVFRSENGGGTWLEECPSCRQVLRAGKELKTHFDGHERERDFPELGKSSGGGSKNNWVRK